MHWAVATPPNIFHFLAPVSAFDPFLFPLFFFVAVFETVSLRSPGWLEIHCAAQAGLEFTEIRLIHHALPDLFSLHSMEQPAMAFWLQIGFRGAELKFPS